jgi:hypothetical protein
MLYYTNNLYLQLVLEVISIHFKALIDKFYHVPGNFSLRSFVFFFDVTSNIHLQNSKVFKVTLSTIGVRHSF